MQYFKHMTNMRDDPRMKRTIARYGIEGYGLYNIILESIAGRIESESPLPILQENCEDIALFYNGNTAKINEMIAFMINQGLFEIEEVEGRILCTKIYKFLEASQTRSDYIRAIIKSYKKGHTPMQITANGVSETVTDICEETVKEETVKEEESKPKKVKPDKYNLPSGEVVPINFTTHNILVDSYGLETVEKYYTKILDYSRTKDRKYKDFASAARSWITGDIEKGNPPPKKKHTAPTEICPACGGPLGPISCGKCGLDVAYKNDEEQVDFYRQRMANRD